MANRETRERKLVALMINDLGPGLGEKELARLQAEVRALPDDGLDHLLAVDGVVQRAADAHILEHRERRGFLRVHVQEDDAHGLAADHLQLRNRLDLIGLVLRDMHEEVEAA